MSTNAYDVAEKLRDASSEETGQLYDALVAEHGQDKAAEIWKRACVENDHEAFIEDAMASLTQLLNAVLKDLGTARGELSRLASGEAWHPNYAETVSGDDMGRFLADAARLIRAAQRIHHGIAEG